MTWIKICGTTNREDALLSVDAGVDALGFVFAPSPRRIRPEDARAIICELPAGIEKVGVFVNESAARIREVVEQARLTAVQLHGDEDPEFAGQLIDDFKNEIGVYVALSFPPRREYFDNGPHPLVRGLVLDSVNAAQRGGTGKTFDWTEDVQQFVSLISDIFPVIIAGGLTPSNVGEAIKLFQPYGVDVVTGVEQERGKKDPEKLRAFINAVRRADENKNEINC